MNKFTIYCTLEQTKKALKLGAPLEKASSREIFNAMGFRDKTFEEMYDFKGCVIINDDVYLTPTSEQMIGWIATKGVFVGVAWDYIINKWESYTHIKNKLIGCDDYDSREEATITAIDEALDYLIKK